MTLREGEIAGELRGFVADLFGIVDTAQNPALYDLVCTSSERVCLFSGQLESELQKASPYLVRVRRDSALLIAWQEEGWGQNWGILCRASCSLEEMRKHFRQFLQARLPDGMIVLFRFYDPRVLRVYLPTCEPIDLAQWFSQVEEFQVESADGDGVVRYSLKGGLLAIE